MNTSQLIKEISERSDISEQDVKKVISEMTIIISESLTRLESIRIKNLCKIEPIILPARKRVSNLNGIKKILEIEKSVKVKLIVAEQIQILLQGIMVESKKIDIKEYFKNLNLD